MDPTDTMTRGGPPPPDDRGLLDRAAQAQVSANAARAAVLETVRLFHANRVAEAQAAKRNQPAFFALTPLEATKAEFGPLLVVGNRRIETDLQLAQDLHQFFPRMWQTCLSGRLDVGRAAVATGYLPQLTNDDDRRAYAELVEEYLDSQDQPDAPVHPVRYLNLQQACRRRCRRFEQQTKQQSFADAFARRRVSLRSDDNGMASLACSSSLDRCQTADYRLTLIAKRRSENPGEKRTIDQLRADTLVDLVLGRVTVAASEAELEDGETADGAPVEDPCEWRDVGRFARPVVNVTVPITTLMGLSDTPGVMAGGTEIPAALCRMIGQDPTSTWYRLVTDPLGGFVELSTNAYQPTEAICRWCIAQNPQCVWPTCSRPATVVELDHRVPYPHGPTSTYNLQPLCEAHHKVKHSDGFSVVREQDGSYTWTSRFGVVSRKPAPEYPLAEWPDEDLLRFCDSHDEGHDETGSGGHSLRLTSPMDVHFAHVIAEVA